MARLLDIIYKFFSNPTIIVEREGDVLYVTSIAGSYWGYLPYYSHNGVPGSRSKHIDCAAVSILYVLIWYM